MSKRRLRRSDRRNLLGRGHGHVPHRDALIPRRLFHPSATGGLGPVTLLTNTFLHGGFLHVLLNMWTFNVFGPALEERLGSVRFLTLYVVSALLASTAHAVFNASSPVPALGASGAIAGVLAGYAISYPYALVRVVVRSSFSQSFSWFRPCSSRAFGS